LTLLAMCVAAFMIQLDVTIVNVALPMIQQSLGSTMGQLEWVVSGYALSLAACIPLAGALGDRYGHKFVFIGGLIVFSIGSAGCAIADSSTALIISRFVQGAGGAAMLALTLAILNQTYPAAVRSQAIGIWAAIGGTGFGAGPVVGGLLLGSFGWASIFWVNLPFAAIASTMALLVVPQGSAAGTKRPLDAVGVVLASVGLASVTFSLIESTSKPWQPLPTLMPAVAGLVALALFALWQRRTGNPLIPVALRRAPSFVGACGVYFASYTAFAGTLYYVTLFYQNFKGWSAFETGLSWLLMNIPFLVTA
jgi:EmrB/QacA subfamily drug resistance transporter